MCMYRIINTHDLYSFPQWKVSAGHYASASKYKSLVVITFKGEWGKITVDYGYRNDPKFSDTFVVITLKFELCGFTID